jgi:hypothetical protein
LDDSTVTCVTQQSDSLEFSLFVVEHVVVVQMDPNPMHHISVDTHTTVRLDLESFAKHQLVCECPSCFARKK